MSCDRCDSKCSLITVNTNNNKYQQTICVDCLQYGIIKRSCSLTIHPIYCKEYESSEPECDRCGSKCSLITVDADKNKKIMCCDCLQEGVIDGFCDIHIINILPTKFTMNRNCDGCNEIIQGVKYFKNYEDKPKYLCRDCFKPQCDCGREDGLITIGKDEDQITICADCLQDDLDNGFCHLKFSRGHGR